MNLKKHSLAGGIWMCIIGGGSLFLGLIYSSGLFLGRKFNEPLWPDEMLSTVIFVIILFVLVGLGLIVGGICVISHKAKQNREIDKYIKEHPDETDSYVDANTPITYITSCPNCGTQLTYRRRDVQSHKNWPSGYIRCYHCSKPVGVNIKLDEQMH